VRHQQPRHLHPATGPSSRPPPGTAVAVTVTGDFWSIRSEEPPPDGGNKAKQAPLPGHLSRETWQWHLRGFSPDWCVDWSAKF
jgi:hypothetical protein